MKEDDSGHREHTADQPVTYTLPGRVANRPTSPDQRLTGYTILNDAPNTAPRTTQPLTGYTLPDNALNTQDFGVTTQSPTPKSTWIRPVDCHDKLNILSSQQINCRLGQREI